MTADLQPQGPALLQNVQQLAVVDAQGVVGQVDLQGGDTGGGHVPQFLASGLVPVGNRHVEGVVAAGETVRLFVPQLQGLRQAVSPVLGGKVDYRGGASADGGQGAGGEVVGGDGHAVVHVQVGVGIDKAGEYQAARGVQHLIAGGGGEGRRNGGDLAALYGQVRPPALFRRDQRTILNDVHQLASILLKRKNSGCNIRPKGRPVRKALRYSRCILHCHQYNIENRL